METALYVEIWREHSNGTTTLNEPTNKSPVAALIYHPLDVYGVVFFTCLWTESINCTIDFYGFEESKVLHFHLQFFSAVFFTKSVDFYSF
jgi:hypothetical protein